MDRYDLYGVQYGTVLIGGITAQNLVTGTTAEGVPSSGSVFPSVMSITAQNPTGGFTTYNLAAALTALSDAVQGIFSAPIDGAAEVLKPLNFYLQKYAEGGGRAAGSVHRKLGIQRGLVYPQMLTCDHQKSATLSYNLLVGYDGTNDPIVPSDTETLPTPLTDAERFTLGPIKIGPLILTAFKRLQIDFGVRAAAEGAESALWPTHTSVVQIAPRITIDGIDPKWFAASGAVALAGLAAAHADTIIYLRKLAIGGTFVADDVAEHISFTLAGLAHMDKVADVSTGPAGVSLSIPLYHDGNNLPLLVSTTAEIESFEEE